MSGLPPRFNLPAPRILARILPSSSSAATVPSDEEDNSGWKDSFLLRLRVGELPLDRHLDFLTEKLSKPAPPPVHHHHKHPSIAAAAMNPQQRLRAADDDHPSTEGLPTEQKQQQRQPRRLQPRTQQQQQQQKREPPGRRKIHRTVSRTPAATAALRRNSRKDPDGERMGICSSEDAEEEEEDDITDLRETLRKLDFPESFEESVFSSPPSGPSEAAGSMTIQDTERKDSIPGKLSFETPARGQGSDLSSSSAVSSHGFRTPNTAKKSLLPPDSSAAEDSSSKGVLVMFPGAAGQRDRSSSSSSSSSPAAGEHQLLTWTEWSFLMDSLDTATPFPTELQRLTADFLYEREEGQRVEFDLVMEGQRVQANVSRVILF